MYVHHSFARITSDSVPPCFSHGLNPVRLVSPPSPRGSQTPPPSPERRSTACWYATHSTRRVIVCNMSVRTGPTGGGGGVGQPSGVWSGPSSLSLAMGGVVYLHALASHRMLSTWRGRRAWDASHATAQICTYPRVSVHDPCLVLPSHTLYRCTPTIAVVAFGACVVGIATVCATTAMYACGRCMHRMRRIHRCAPCVACASCAHGRSARGAGLGAGGGANHTDHAGLGL